MGPLILVDKSFLQSLSQEEAKALHKHYTVCIPQILLRELIGNLVKSDYAPDDATRRVISLASKAHGSGFLSDTIVVPDPRDIIFAELSGQPVPLQPGIPRFGARRVVGADGSIGFVFDETESKSDESMLQDWEKGRFSDEDKAVAKSHADDLENYDLRQEEMQKQFQENKRFKTLDEVVQAYQESQKTVAGREITFAELLRHFHEKPEVVKGFKDAWEKSGKPPLAIYNKYGDFYSLVMTVFFLGVTANLISPSRRQKTLIDVLYFLNLPFVHIFCSGDNFHKDNFQFFARPDQEFIWGPELKADLANIASFHANLNEKDRLAYEIDFGHYPPPIPDSITTKIWQKYCGYWKPGSGNKALARTPEENKIEHEKIMKIINEHLKKEKKDD